MPKGRTISRAKFEAVEELLKAGESYRATSLATGVSRGTVQTIAHGNHTWQRPGADAIEATETGPPFGDEVGRCPTCGGKVHLPCYGCAMEARAEAKRKAKRKAA